MKKDDDEQVSAAERLAAKCVEARRRFELSEVDFYDFLWKVEDEERPTWSFLGTFETFIERYVGRPNPAKWSRYRAARQKLGVDRIREMGVPAAIQSTFLADENVTKFADAAGAWSRQHGGVHMSEQKAKDQAREIQPAAKEPTPLRIDKERSALKEENAALREQVRVLTKENRELRERLAAQGAKDATKKATARKAAGKHSESRRS